MSERGTVTLWLLGLCVCLFFLAGLSVDLWRVMNVRRELVSVADAAAIAGANAVDDAAWRAHGTLMLDVASARARVASHLALRLPPGTRVETSVTSARVRVALSRTVPLSLLGALMPDERLRVSVDAVVEPQRHP